jgi:FK506-binding nuclear protein
LFDNNFFAFYGHKDANSLTQEADKEEPFQTRIFAKGMIIQELEMGKPDGKRATRGKKV